MHQPRSALITTGFIPAALILFCSGCNWFSRQETPDIPLTHRAVATNSSLATVAASNVLSAGGTAADAAVAAALMLNVAEPWNSGLGGGGFALVYEPRSGGITSLDFRETAPAALDTKVLEKAAAANPNALTDGPLAAAVPGLWPGLLELHRRFGKLPLKEITRWAAGVAESGFPVSASYQNRCLFRHDVLAADPEAKRIFLKPDGTCPETGWTLTQSELSALLKKLGSDDKPELWTSLVAGALAARLNPSGNALSAEDVRNYRPKEREPIRGKFRDREIVSMGPPSSGGSLVIELLQTYEAAGTLYPDASPGFLWVEASRLAFFDRAKLLGDPDFVKVPVKTLASPAYAASQARRITPGSPLPLPDADRSPAEGLETTHLSVIDGEGMAVSMTLSINTPFGSGVVIPGTGVLLNNHMDDFYVNRPNSYGLVGNDRNAPLPGKRPLSSMSPTFVLKDGKLVAALGSPGGSRIPTAVAWVIRELIDNGADGRSAVCTPRMHHQWRPDTLSVEDGFAPAPFQKMGYTTSKPLMEIGNVQMVLKTPTGWRGYSDCRGDGIGWEE